MCAFELDFDLSFFSVQSTTSVEITIFIGKKSPLYMAFESIIAIKTNNMAARDVLPK